MGVFKNENMTFSASQYCAVMKLKTVEERAEAFKLLILQGLEGRKQRSENVAIDILLEMSMSYQASAWQRYERALANGKNSDREE